MRTKKNLYMMKIFHFLMIDGEKTSFVKSLHLHTHKNSRVKSDNDLISVSLIGGGDFFEKTMAC